MVPLERFKLLMFVIEKQLITNSQIICIHHYTHVQTNKIYKVNNRSSKKYICLSFLHFYS